MSRRKYTDEDRQLILQLYNKTNGNITKTAKKFARKVNINYDDGVRRHVSYLLEKEEVTSNKIRIEDSDVFKEAQSRKLSKSKYYIVTYAQNATPIHDNFFNNILAYKDFLSAELSVILGRYKNPTSVWTDKSEKLEWWANEIKPYRDANRHDIHKFLTIASDIKIQPTAANPLTSLEHISFDKTCIVGHPKIQLKSIPVLEGHPKKVLMSTGACTIPNYTDSKAGKKGESHHKFGFVIVEIKNDKIFFIRQVEADKDGNFYDLFHKVFDGKVTKVKECPAIVLGDIHHRYLDEGVEKATNELFKHLNPKEVVIHDLFDGDSINHWESKNPFKRYERYSDGRDILLREIDDALTWLEKKLPYNPIVVRSNHDEWIDRWIQNKDWKTDIPNSIAYMEYSLATLKGEAPNGILPYVIKNKFGDKIKCLGVNDSYKIKDYEIANHGYYGQSGSKGSIVQFRRLNTKVIVGDYHTPSRLDNAIGVGVSCVLRPDYNVGASGWLHCHAIIHENNTAQQIIFIENEFTTFL